MAGKRGVDIFDRRYIHRVSLYPGYADSKVYPYSIPSIRRMGVVELNENVTFFVGENGSGKSTLVEAIAVGVGFPSGGGSPHKNDVAIHGHGGDLDGLDIKLGIGGGSFDGFFLRAESFFNVASDLDERVATSDYGDRQIKAYGGRSLHKMSHGESFMALIGTRFDGGGLFILDEPEAALSPSRQLVLLGIIDNLARQQRSQFIIATHSPILLAYPHATIYELSSDGVRQVEYEDTEHYKVTLDFLRNRDVYVARLCGDVSDEG